MNWKKFFIAFVAVWIFIFIYGFIFHVKIMHSSYAEVPAMWRPESEAIFPLIVLGQGVIAFFFTLIFVRGFGSGGGMAGGFRYGLLLGLLVCGVNLIRYAVEPITTTMLIGWCIGEIIQLSLAGFIVGALYKPLEAAS
jgi:hypothetical protein